MINSSRLIIAKTLKISPKFTISQLKHSFQQSRYYQSSNQLSSKKLANKVAIVTGSTEGIGLAIAKKLAEDGAKVLISSRKQANVDKAVNELQNMFPNQIAGTVCHVGKEDDRENLVKFCLDKFGGRIDIFVSNAAVNPSVGPFLETTESQWDKIFDVNVKAPFLLTQKVVPYMLNNKGLEGKGSIIYISSIGGYFGLNTIGAYTVSKTALLGLCKNVSMELANKGIRANLVAPGLIETRFSGILRDNDGYWKSSTHMKRLGKANEISGIVSFLCSPEASYITGENIAVAGGHYCKL